ncbi:MAG: beta-lactamase family protein [bacterium]|nr:beta-lactamase family protein [bacterium]
MAAFEGRRLRGSITRFGRWLASVAVVAWGLACVVVPGVDQAPETIGQAAQTSITEAMQAAVDRGAVGGVVTLVHHRGEVVHAAAVGLQDPAAGIAMQRDSIFRIASMTKPITAVATMILVDEGRLRLDDAIDPWLPELAAPTVLRDPTAALETAVPAARSIRVVDLLTHSAGIATPRTPEGPLRRALMAADAKNAAGYDAWLSWVGALPLAAEPGSTFLYGNSFDVLGILVERVSGQKYPDFVRERIFAPLGMVDTDFRIPEAKLGRFARLQDLGSVPPSWIPSEAEIPGFPAAAGGLYSTADDYLRFARMLHGGGRLGEVRILSEASVATMTRNHLSADQRRGEPFANQVDFWAGQGFGLGVAVKEIEGVATAELGVASIGAFAWPGIFGTWWQVDPALDLILVFMVPGGEARPVRWAFQAAVYEALSADPRLATDGPASRARPDGSGASRISIRSGEDPSFPSANPSERS